MSDTDVLPTNEQFDGWDYIFPGGYADPTFETATLPREPVKPVTRQAVAEVTHFYADDGGEGYASTDLAALMQLTDGRWASVQAWCDTTGWDCQSGARWHVGTREDVIRNGLDKTARERFELLTEGGAPDA